MRRGGVIALATLAGSGAKHRSVAVRRPYRGRRLRLAAAVEPTLAKLRGA
jgi:hypothetical protein